MAFVMISIGTVSRAGVRTVTGRSLAVVGALAAAALLGAGTAVGYALADPAPVVEASAPAAAPGPHPFALEQIGALSGRLFKLESEAGALAKRLGLLPAEAAKPAAPRPEAKPATGSGGPMLPARDEHGLADPLAALHERLADIQARLELIGERSALRHLQAMTWPSLLPVAGAEIGSRYGNRVDPITGRRAFHGGVDIAAEMGTPILASAGGRVLFAGARPDFGWTVEIGHGDGLVTRYAHASRLLVKAGDIVAPGDRVALVGSSGRSTGPHLHFEVLRHGGHTDPRRYLAGL